MVVGLYGVVTAAEPHPGAPPAVLATQLVRPSLRPGSMASKPGSPVDPVTLPPWNVQYPPMTLPALYGSAAAPLLPPSARMVFGMVTNSLPICTLPPMLFWKRPVTIVSSDGKHHDAVLCAIGKIVP